MIGGVQHVDASGTKVHGGPHMLLVGDPWSKYILGICKNVEKIISNSCKITSER